MTAAFISDSVPQIAGYHVLRPLSAEQSAWLVTCDATGRPGVLRVMPVDAQQRLRDIAHLVAHGIEVADAWTNEPGEVVVVEEYLPHSLAQLLESRLSPGEVVTVLVPLVETLESLRGRGWWPGDLRVADVGIDETGRARISNDVLLNRVAGSGQVLTQLPVIAELLALLPGFDIREVQGSERLVPALLQAFPPCVIVLSMVHRASARPLRFSPELSEHDDEIPVNVTGELRHLRDRVLQKLLTIRTRLRPSALTSRPHARRTKLMLVSTGTAGVLIVIALLVIPPSGSTPASVQSDSTVEPSVGTSAVAVPASGDAASAARALLSARASCAAAADSLDCISGVDQEGSSISAEDRERLATGQRLRLETVAAELPVVLSVMGQAALVGVGTETNPASVLLVQTEAGWRLREVFDSAG
ncbi:MAG: hypothetical protein ACOYBP_06515 [Microbacteriaceae bacterium]